MCEKSKMFKKVFKKERLNKAMLVFASTNLLTLAHDFSIVNLQS